MEERKRRQQHVVLADAEKPRRVDAPPEVLGVRAADALREAGRAGGIENRERVARLDRMRRHAHSRLRKRSRFEPRLIVRISLAHQPQRLDGDPRAVQCSKNGRQLTFDHEEPGAAIAENVRKLRPPRGGIDGNGDCAQPSAAEEGQQHFRAVAAHDGDAIAGLDAGAGERLGVARGGRQGVGIGERPAPDRHEAAPGVALGLAREHLRQCAFGWCKEPGKRGRTGWIVILRARGH